jgi:hypothetical protein
MPEEETEHSTDTKVEHIHHGIKTEELEERLAKERRELHDLIHEGTAADKAEKDELRERISTLEKQLKEEKEAKEKKENASGAEHTIVLPPGQVEQQQHHEEDREADVTEHSEEGKKGGGWKRFW